MFAVQIFIFHKNIQIVSFCIFHILPLTVEASVMKTPDLSCFQRRLAQSVAVAPLQVMTHFLLNQPSGKLTFPYFFSFLLGFLVFYWWEWGSPTLEGARSAIRGSTAFGGKALLRAAAPSDAAFAQTKEWTHCPDVFSAETFRLSVRDVLEQCWMCFFFFFFSSFVSSRHAAFGALTSPDIYLNCRQIQLYFCLKVSK